MGLGLGALLLTVWVGTKDGLRESVRVAVGVRTAEGLSVTETVVAVGLEEREHERPVPVRLHVGELDRDLDALRDALGEGHVGVRLVLRDRERVWVWLAVGDRDTVVLAEWERLQDGVGLALGLWDRVGTADRDREGLWVGVAEAVGVAMHVPVEWVSVPERLELGGDGDMLRLPDRAAVPVLLHEADAVCVALALRSSVRDRDVLRDRVADGVCVGREGEGE